MLRLPYVECLGKPYLFTIADDNTLCGSCVDTLSGKVIDCAHFCVVFSSYLRDCSGVNDFGELEMNRGCGNILRNAEVATIGRDGESIDDAELSIAL